MKETPLLGFPLVKNSLLTFQMRIVFWSLAFSPCASDSVTLCLQCTEINCTSLGNTIQNLVCICNQVQQPTAPTTVSVETTTISLSNQIVNEKLTNLTSLVFNLTQNLKDAISRTTDQATKKTLAEKELKKIIVESNKITEDLSLQGQQYKPAVVTSLIKMHDESAQILASTLNIGQNSTIYSNHLTMSALNVDTTKSFDAVFPFEYANQESKADSVNIPISVIKELANTHKVNNIPVSAVWNLGLGQMLKPKDVLPSEMSKISVNSAIISVTIPLKFGSAYYRKPFSLVFNNITDIGKNTIICAFWDSKLSNWSTNGCDWFGTVGTETTCMCNHLTSFAILLRVSGSEEAELTSENQFALQFITILGCSLSIVFFIACFITFACYKSLKSERNTIHKNLVFVLALGQLLFIIGVERTEHAIACSIIAGALHYIFLTAFAWMFLEGIQIYLKLVLVFEPTKSLLPFYYGFGYGTPIIIVSISAGIFHEGYGTTTYCWLNDKNNFRWSFLGPVLTVIIVNIFMLGIAIKVMCQHFRSSSRRDMETTHKMAMWIKGALMLAVLLGVTWIFGFFQIGATSVILSYIFVLFNSFQGIFFFFFHCLGNEKIRKEYRRSVKGAEWLPVCIQQLCFRLLITSSAEELTTTSGPISTVSRSKSPYEKNRVSEVTESVSLHVNDSDFQAHLHDEPDHSEVDAKSKDKIINTTVEDDSEMKEDQRMQKTYMVVNIDKSKEDQIQPSVDKNNKKGIDKKNIKK